MKEENKKFKKNGCEGENDKKGKCECEHEHECDCQDINLNENKNCQCTCDEDCDCGCQESEHDCTCHHENEEGRERHHNHHHEKHQHDDCSSENHCDCGCEDNENQYLMIAQRLQADFDNYRKRVAEQLDFQREEGKKSVIEVFLPCLDTFKEAKKSISDESVLSGINMIEEKILNALKTLKVERIESVRNVYDHNLHEVIAVMKDENYENNVILEEFQAGYTMNGKVIRFSKVIVNKLD